MSDAQSDAAQLHIFLFFVLVVTAREIYWMRRRRAWRREVESRKKARGFMSIHKTVATLLITAGLALPTLAAGPATQPTAKPTTAPATQPTAAAAKAPAKKVVYLVDVSGSMINHLSQAKEAVTIAIRELPADASFGIVTAMATKTETWKPAMQKPTPANVATAQKWIDDLGSSGKDGLDLGIAAAAKLKPDVVWIATDGDLSYQRDKIMTAIKQAAAVGKFRVNVVVFTELPANANTAVELATAGGGISVDKEGVKVETKAITVAAKPAAPAPPAPTKPGKSIFRE